MTTGCPNSREPGAGSDGSIDSGATSPDGGRSPIDAAAGDTGAVDAGTVDAGAPEAGTAPTDAGIADAGPPPPTRDVDMLFVVDNSNSMREEQETLSEQFPRIVRALLTGDRDGDGTRDTTPVNSLHLGVVTTDLGVGRVDVSTCDGIGQDGILLTTGNPNLTGCDGMYPPFQDASQASESDTVAAEFRCVAEMGTGGCGFEQQLEATLKAVTLSTSPLTFAGGTRGHADGANAGFLRPDSLLVVIVLSDEPDCSVSDLDLFNPDSTVYTANLNLRCFEHPNVLHPVERYVQGLLATRSHPSRLMFGVIAGVPPDLLGSGSPDFAQILADDRMQLAVDPAGQQLVSSCDVDGRGRAYPPRRMVETARQLQSAGAQVNLASICQDDYSLVLDPVLSYVAQAAN